MRPRLFVSILALALLSSSAPAQERTYSYLDGKLGQVEVVVEAIPSHGDFVSVILGTRRGAVRVLCQAEQAADWLTRARALLASVTERAAPGETITTNARACEQFGDDRSPVMNLVRRVRSRDSQWSIEFRDEGGINSGSGTVTAADVRRLLSAVDKARAKLAG
jgi:hypothetical protein